MTSVIRVVGIKTRGGFAGLKDCGSRRKGRLRFYHLHLAALRDSGAYRGGDDRSAPKL